MVGLLSTCSILLEPPGEDLGPGVRRAGLECWGQDRVKVSRRLEKRASPWLQIQHLSMKCDARASMTEQPWHESDGNLHGCRFYTPSRNRCQPREVLGQGLCSQAELEPCVCHQTAQLLLSIQVYSNATLSEINTATCTALSAALPFPSSALTTIYFTSLCSLSDSLARR